MAKIGIFSGTFDPVHMGHIAFAIETMHDLELQKVVFLPEAEPRGKSPTALAHRYKMLELSVAHTEGLSVKLLDMPRFDIEKTLPELKRLYGDETLVFLLGSDVVRTFSYRWPGLEDLFMQVELAIGLRSDDEREEIVELLKQSAQSYGTAVTFHIIPSPRAQLASTMVRSGDHVVEDIHPDVARYIQEHSLYVG